MKKIIFLSVLSLIALALTITSCNKEGQFYTTDLSKQESNRLIDDLEIDQTVDSLTKLGYKLDKDISTKDFLFYKLNKKTFFMNRKNILKAKMNTARFSPAVGHYTIFRNKSIQAGIMSPEAPDHINDDGAYWQDEICINLWGPGITMMSFDAEMDFCCEDLPENRWAKPVAPHVNLEIHADSWVIGQLNNAAQQDPVSSFVKNN